MYWSVNVNVKYNLTRSLTLIVNINLVVNEQDIINTLIALIDVGPTSWTPFY